MPPFAALSRRYSWRPPALAPVLSARFSSGQATVAVFFPFRQSSPPPRGFRNVFVALSAAARKHPEANRVEPHPPRGRLSLAVWNAFTSGVEGD